LLHHRELADSRAPARRPPARSKATTSTGCAALALLRHLDDIGARWQRHARVDLPQVILHVLDELVFVRAAHTDGAVALGAIGVHHVAISPSRIAPRRRAV